MSEDRPGEHDLPGDEEEVGRPPGAGRLVIRFFLLPLFVVGTAVGIFLLFSLMTFERRSPRDYLSEVQGGSAGRRWQAAFELSRRIGAMRSGRDGRYSVQNLPPGEYRVATATDLEQWEWYDPEVLERLLLAGTPVKITGPERVTLDLQIK